MRHCDASSVSTGFVIYSWLLGNWVFIVTNALLLATGVFGQVSYLRARRLKSMQARDAGGGTV